MVAKKSGDAAKIKVAEDDLNDAKDKEDKDKVDATSAKVNEKKAEVNKDVAVKVEESTLPGSKADDLKKVEATAEDAEKQKNVAEAKVDTDKDKVDKDKVEKTVDIIDAENKAVVADNAEDAVSKTIKTDDPGGAIVSGSGSTGGPDGWEAPGGGGGLSSAIKKAAEANGNTCVTKTPYGDKKGSDPASKLANEKDLTALYKGCLKAAGSSKMFVIYPDDANEGSSNCWLCSSEAVRPSKMNKAFLFKVSIAPPAEAALATAEETIRAGMVVAFKGGRSKQYCADEGGKVICDRDIMAGWELFTVSKATGTNFALKGGKDDKFCSWRNKKLKCDRSEVTKTEEFIIQSVDAAGGSHTTVVLKTPGGPSRFQLAQFCADDSGGIVCDRTKLNAWEKYTLVVKDDGQSVVGKLDVNIRKTESSTADKKKAELELASAKHEEDLAAEIAAKGGEDAIKKKEEASEKVQMKITAVVHLDQKVDKLVTENQALVDATKTTLGGANGGPLVTEDGDSSSKLYNQSVADGSITPTGKGRGAYFCCASSTADGGLSTLGDVLDDNFRIDAMPFVKKTEEVFQSNLPEIISEEALFQSTDGYSVNSIALKKATEAQAGDDEETTVDFDLELPVIRDLCRQVQKTLVVEMPSTESVPLVTAVETAGFPDKASIEKIVKTAGGSDAAKSFCRSCGDGGHLPDLVMDVLKPVGVALLAKDCVKLTEKSVTADAEADIAKLHVEVKFTESGMSLKVIAGKNRLVVQGDIKADKLNSMCVPVTYFPGALSILFCSQGGDLPDMVTKGGNTIKHGHKFGIQIAVGAAELPVAGLSRRTALFPLYPSGLYAMGELPDEENGNMFAACKVSKSAALPVRPPAASESKEEASSEADTSSSSSSSSSASSSGEADTSSAPSSSSSLSSSSSSSSSSPAAPRFRAQLNKHVAARGATADVREEQKESAPEDSIADMDKEVGSMMSSLDWDDRNKPTSWDD